MTALPTGWSKSRLGELTRAEYGKGLTKQTRAESGSVPVYGSAGVAGYHDEALVDGPTIVIGRKGNAGAVFLSTGPCWPIDTTYFLRLPAGVDAAYVAHFLRAARLSGLDSSTAIPSLRREDLERQEVPIPPLNEQRRIVAAIEEQFSRIEAAEESLLRAKKRLSLLRSAALSAAIDGDWPLERLGEIAHTTSGGTPSRRRPDYFDGPIPWVKSGELRDGRVRTTEETLTELGLAESSAKIFERGTLLIALYGATVGKLGILDTDAATNQAVCAIKPHDPEMVPYLWIVLRQKRAELVAAGQGGAQPNISQAILRRLRIPVPPPDEQRRLVEEVERQLSITDAMAAEVERAFHRSGALRRAILEQAFTARLVPCDPSDEPASVLLERIAAERATAPQPSRRKRKISA